MYIEDLIGRETVNTMPKETIEAFQDHGEVRPTLEEASTKRASSSTSWPRSAWTTTT